MESDGPGPGLLAYSFFGLLPAFAAGCAGAPEVSGFVLFIPDSRPVPAHFESVLLRF
jgi:hypothetical protein